MKRLALILFLASACAISAQTDQVKLREQIKSLKQQQREAVDRAENDAKKAKEHAVTLSENLEKAQAQVDKIGEERDGWRDYGNDQHEKWINAEKRVAEEKTSTAKQANAKLKWMGAFFGLVVLIGAFVWFKLSPLGRFSPI